MKKIITEIDPKPQTPSPKNSISSSSSSDFEFTVSLSPRKTSINLCPADELFCNGHLLPLHHSRRLSSVRTLLSSSSTSSSTDSATTSRNSSGSSSTDSRSSSANSNSSINKIQPRTDHDMIQTKKTKTFSLSRFSSVFRKEPKNHNLESSSSSSSSKTRVKGIGSTAKEVIKKYFKKVQMKMGKGNPFVVESGKNSRSELISGKSEEGRFSLSFSGNLRYPMGRNSLLPSLPSSTRTSPTHSGVLRRRGSGQSMSSGSIEGGGLMYSAATDMSSMEELQSSIQGAIAHCKNSLIKNKSQSNNNDYVTV